MKNIIWLTVLLMPTIMAADCGKHNNLTNPSTPTVKLNTTINDSAENILLGDTLKFTLIVPDTLTVISKLDGTSSKLVVNSLQECNYNYKFYSIDSISKVGTRILNISNAFVTIGTAGSSEANVYTSTASKPYKAILNIIPPTKGIYYISFGGQETFIKANGSFIGGARVNISVNNKHWNLYSNIFGSTSLAGFQQNENDGYGFYCFRVV